MHTLKATASSSLGLPAESYIYSIAASAPGSFAAISSDDSLRVFDAANLDRVSVISRKTHDGVSALRSYTGDSQLLVTGGREGSVKVWDVRAGNAVVEMETGESVSFSIVFFSAFCPCWVLNCCTPRDCCSVCQSGRPVWYRRISASWLQGWPWPVL